MVDCLFLAGLVGCLLGRGGRLPFFGRGGRLPFGRGDLLQGSMLVFLMGRHQSGRFLLLLCQR